MAKKETRILITLVGLALITAAFLIASQAVWWSGQLSFQTLPLGGMVSLNFDDGFASAHAHGWPIIKASGLPSTHYVITNYLDHQDYLTSQEVLAMERAGAEIGAHSRTHPSLGQIDRYDLDYEIAGARADLLQIGVKKVETFAYPYGSYNDSAIEAVKKAGYVGARSFDFDFNDRSTDKYLLKHWGVTSSETWPEIKNEIDEAMREKKWLILVFHRIDEDGNSTSLRHEVLQQIVDYLKEQKILVVTNSEGLRLVAS